MIRYIRAIKYFIYTIWSLFTGHESGCFVGVTGSGAQWMRVMKTANLLPGPVNGFWALLARTVGIKCPGGLAHAKPAVFSGLMTYMISLLWSR